MSTIYKLHKKLINKEVSSVELTKEYLAKIKKNNSELNAFITVCEEESLKQAAQADKLIASGEAEELTGIPFAVKDNFCTKDIRTTAGSKILENYIPPYTASAVSKIKGGVMLGKTNMDEFAMGSSGETSAYGVTKNPLDKTRVTGGSSSGSVAAVASDECVFALGTDTSGSIRQPASFCGVTGLKPTYGRISRYGVVALASSIDTVGPITKDARDAAMVLKSLAGRDDFDSTTSNLKIDDYLKEIEKPVKGMKLGVPKEFFSLEGLNSEVKKIIEKAIENIKKLGVEIKEVSLPHTKYAIPVYFLINFSEVSSNLARYDGIKYGYRAKETNNLLEVYLKTRKEALGDEVKRRVMMGAYSLSAGYYDAYYKKASQVRTKIVTDFKNAFKEVDLLLSPTTPTTAFKIGEKQDPLAMYLADILTAPASCAGVPAISIKAGEADNLPVGLQIIGNYFKESDILRLAASYQHNFTC